MLDLNTLLNSVTHIGNRAFNYTAAYYNEANWENDLFYIGNCLLESRQHTGAEPIAVKNGTRLIADYAFSCYFQNVTEIVIPDTVTHIGEDAMLSCYSPERISVSEKNTKCRCEPINMAENLFLLLLKCRSEEHTSELQSR